MLRRDCGQLGSASGEVLLRAEVLGMECRSPEAEVSCSGSTASVSCGHTGQRVQPSSGLPGLAVGPAPSSLLLDTQISWEFCLS